MQIFKPFTPVVRASQGAQTHLLVHSFLNIFPIIFLNRIFFFIDICQLLKQLLIKLNDNAMYSSESILLHIFFIVGDGIVIHVEIGPLLKSNRGKVDPFLKLGHHHLTWPWHYFTLKSRFLPRLSCKISCWTSNFLVAAK